MRRPGAGLRFVPIFSTREAKSLAGWFVGRVKQLAINETCDPERQPIYLENAQQYRRRHCNSFCLVGLAMKEV